MGVMKGKFILAGLGYMVIGSLLHFRLCGVRRLLEVSSHLYAQLTDQV